MSKYLKYLALTLACAAVWCCHGDRGPRAQSTMMNLESDQSVTGEKTFVNFLGLPVCGANPPIGVCETNDICLNSTGALYTCPAGAWIEVGVSGGDPGTPGGNDTEVQIKSGAVFDGVTGFTYDGTQVVNAAPWVHEGVDGGASFDIKRDAGNSSCDPAGVEFTKDLLNVSGFYWCSDGDPLTGWDNNISGDGLAHFAVPASWRIDIISPFLFKDWRIMDFTDIRDVTDPDGPMFNPGIDCPTDDPVALNATSCAPVGSYCTTRGNGITEPYGVAYECGSFDSTWDLYQPLGIKTYDVDAGLEDRGGCTFMFTDPDRIAQNGIGIKGSVCYDDVNRQLWVDSSGNDTSAIPAAYKIGADDLYIDGVKITDDRSSQNWGFRSDNFEADCDPTGGICGFDNPIMLGLRNWLNNQTEQASLHGVSTSSLIGIRYDSVSPVAGNDGIPLWLYYEPVLSDGVTRQTWADVDGDGYMEDALIMNRGIVFTGVDVAPDYDKPYPAKVQDPWVDPNGIYSDNTFDTHFLPVEPNEDAIVLLPNEEGTLAMRDDAFKSYVFIGPDAADTIRFIRAPYDLEVIGIDCLAIGGTDIVLDVQEADANGGSGVSMLVSPATCTSGTNITANITDTTVDQGDYINFVLGTENGVVTELTVTLRFRKTDE